MDKVKIGVVGCGSITQFAHLPALMKADGVKLDALCEGRAELLQAMGGRYGVHKLFTDYDGFLADAEVDAVILAVPDRLHVSMSIQALEAGKHVLVEKPLGVDIGECNRLVEVVKNSGRILQVGSMKRHDPGIEYAQRFIAEKMGQRLSVNAWYCDSCFRYQLQHTLLSPLVKAEGQVHTQADARENKEKYYLMTHGVHVVDTIQYLGGGIVAVRANLAKQFDCHSWHCLLEFADGAIGHLELTVHIKSDWHEGFVVHGEYGSVEGRTFLPFFRRPSEVRISDVRNVEYRMPMSFDGDPYERQLESFVRAILEGGPVTPGVEDGLADLKVLRAMESAVTSGRRIETI